MVSGSGASFFGITRRSWRFLWGWSLDAVTSGPSVKEFVRIPALIALVVTLARLIGELGGRPAMLFNKEPGGAGSLVGIVWLVPIFGIYFALKLTRSGHAPQSAGKVIGFSAALSRPQTAATD